MFDTIQEGVYDITVGNIDTERGPRRFRAFLFTTDVPTLVDTGLADSTDTLFEAIEELGTTPERVVITHGDPDHIGGLKDVIDRFDPETWVPQETQVPTDVEPDHRFGDGDTIGQFSAIHVSGHEPDNYVLIDESIGIAVMGDAVSGADQRGLPEGFFILPPADKSENLNEAEASLEKLISYEFDVGLVFHGSSVTSNAGEKISQFVNYPGKR